MKKLLALSFVIPALLAGCGDTIENQTGMDVFASADDLPKCTKGGEGDIAFVKDENATRICIDGEWVSSRDTVYLEDGDFSCKAVELKDKSGVKIVCNGDSIGVVLNGKDGEAGKNGKDGAKGKDGESGTGCTITDRTDTTVVVTCGDSTMTIDLGVALPNDTAEADSERTPISLDSLVGFTQKGPFLKGSTVYLYELSDGRTLKQTNGNFTSNITSDDGRYKFLARDLVSQYAMVVVDGYYRNEVTGKSSNAAIRLKALTDMRKRSSVNVNLLTHLEFERVYHLVTRGDASGKKMTVKQAKRQAQKEILKEFMIELKDETDAEDMDVFGSSEADAALLAISILLQGGRTESELMALLTEISTDMAEDGKWNASSKKVDSIKASLADWAISRNVENNLDEFRDNVKGWGISTTVPEFQKYVHNFYETILELGKCGEKDNDFGKITFVTNPHSTYRARSYLDRINMGRFICKADNRWHWATDWEKDTYNWNPGKIGTIKLGTITDNPYLYNKEGWFPISDSYDLFDGKEKYNGIKGIKSPESNLGIDVYLHTVGDYYYDDPTEGSSEITYLQSSTENIYNDEFANVVDTCGGVCGSFSLGTLSWGKPFVGFGFNFDGQGAYEYVVDISSWQGLCVTYQASYPILLELYTNPYDNPKYGWEYDTLVVILPVSEVDNTVCAGWDDFKIKGTESGSDLGTDFAKVVHSIYFMFEGEGHESGKFNVKGFSRVSGAGATTSGYSAVTNPVVCGDLWCGTDYNYVVKTWLDDDSHGFWFDSTDASVGGNSSITYSASELGAPLKTVLDEVLNNCGGICGSFSLRDAFDWPFAYVGFTLSETGDSAKDISSWEGVCVSYKSDVSIKLEIGLTPEREELVEHNVPVAIMRKSSDISVADLPWSKFKGEVGWGNPIPTAEAVKEAVSMRFRMDGVIGSQGDFTIYSIGRLGTCTP